MRTPTFEELVGNEQRFFAEYFDQRPLLRRKALTGEPGEILGSGNLDDLLNSGSLRLSHVAINRPRESYRQNMRIQGETVTDGVSPDRVYEHFRSGATIQFYALNHFFPNLRELTTMLGGKFAVRSDAVSFLSSAGAAQSAGCHHDPVDVFIIQLEGRKSWRVWPTPRDRQGGFATLEPAELGEPVLEVDLEPGDVLYLPYNTPHHVTAKNEMSLHLSVAVKSRPWSALLTGLVEDIVDSDPMFSAFPYLDEISLAEQATALKEKITALVERLTRVDTTERVRHLMEAGRRTEGVPPSGHLFSETAAIDRVDEATTFVPGPTALSFRETSEGKTPLDIKITGQASADGKSAASTRSATIRVPAEVADSLRRMGRSGSIRAGELFPGVPPERSVEVAKTLARVGVLAMASGESAT